MTEAQAEAVVRMQLGQLAALERDEIIKEYNDLRGKIVGYEELLGERAEHPRRHQGRPGRAARQVRRRPRDRDHRRGRPDRPRGPDRRGGRRPSRISHNGYIKRLPLNTYRTQHRGGKGVSGGAARDDDFIEHFFVASTHAYLLCFTNRGQLYWLKVYDIPEGSRTAGRPGHRQRAVAQAGGEDHQRHPGAHLRRDAGRHACIDGDARAAW